MCSLEKQSRLCAGRPEPLEFRTAQRSLPRATGPQTEERPHWSIYSEPQQPCISPDSNLTIPGLCRGTGNTWGQGCGLFAITPVSWWALVGWYRQTPCRSRVGRSIWGTCRAAWRVLTNVPSVVFLPLHAWESYSDPDPTYMCLLGSPSLVRSPVVSGTVSLWPRLRVFLHIVPLQSHKPAIMLWPW